MRTSSVIVGALAGIAIGLGGVVVADVATEPADAQGGSVSAADLKAANERSQSAIRRATNLQNALGKYFTPNGVRIGTRQPPGVIRQDAGTGQNGLPSSTILNGAITNPKLANEAVNSEKIAPGGVTSGDLANNSVTGEKIDAGAVTGEKIAAGAVSTGKIANEAVTSEKLAPGQKQYWAVATGFPFQITSASDPGITGSRINAGNYRVNFGKDVSGCSWNAIPYAPAGTGFPGAQTALVLGDANSNQIQVRTLNPLSDTAPAFGQSAESNFMVQVFC